MFLSSCSQFFLLPLLLYFAIFFLFFFIFFLLFRSLLIFFFFFFNDTATTEIYTLSLHDALPISLKIYLKNLAYNKCSSEFYEWFSDRHSSKPFFHLYELSLELLIKSPFFFKILESASELPITGNDSVFNNYQNLLNRVALKLEPSYKKVTGGDTKSFVFSLNRIRRSIVKETFLSRPLYKKSYVYFKQLPPVSLNLFSPFSILKFANFELLEKRSVRSKLRVLLRDPFLFLNKSGKAGKGMVFRRFLWSNIFRSEERRVGKECRSRWSS